MKSLNHEARMLLEVGRDADDPTPSDYDRVHAALEKRIALGIAASVAALGTTSVATGSAAAATPAALAGTGANAAMAGTSAGVVAAGATGLVSGGAAASAGTGASVAGSMTAAASGLGSVVLKAGACLALMGAVATGSRQAVLFVGDLHDQAARAEARSSMAPAPASVVAAKRSPKARATGPAVTMDRDEIAAPVPHDVAPPAASRAPQSPPSENAARVPFVLVRPRGSTPDRSSNAVRSPPAPAARATEPAVPDEPLEPNAAQASSAEAAPASIALDEEVASLRDARAELRSGGAARALEILDRASQRFPDGVLAEDRAAERIFALCALGRADEARALGVQFVREHPRSTHAASVEASCAGIDNGGNESRSP